MSYSFYCRHPAMIKHLCVKMTIQSYAPLKTKLLVAYEKAFFWLFGVLEDQRFMKGIVKEFCS